MAKTHMTYIYYSDYKSDHGIKIIILHSSYAFFIRAYTHVKVEFALHPTYEITKFIKGQHSVSFVYDLMCIC